MQSRSAVVKKVSISMFRSYLLPRLFRALPVGFRGKAKIARLLLGSFLDSTGQLIITTNSGQYFVPSLKEPIGFHLLTDGIYEKTVLDFILDNVTSGSIFVDVGANIGTMTIPVAKTVGDKGKIVAVEASPEICKYLHHNVALNKLNNVDIIECAVTDSDNGATPFYEAPPDHFGMGSIACQFHNNVYFRYF
jgi:hypothetical protein